MKSKYVVIAFYLLLGAATAHADVSLSATHRLVDATDNGENTQVTIDVTVTNNGEALSNITLNVREIFFADDQIMTFDVGALNSGDSRVLHIDTTSNYSASFFQEGQMFSLTGSAISVAGDVELSLASDGEK